MNRLNYLFVIIAAFFWGIIGIFVKNLATFSSIQIVAVRMIVSAISLTAFLLITNRQKLKFHLKDSWYFIGSGIVGIVFFNWCYFNSIRLNSISIAAILLYTAPAIVTVMSLFLFREKLNIFKVLALLFAFAGILLVSGVGSGKISLTIMGIFFGLGSGIGYALYSIFTKFALQKYDSLTTTTFTFIFATIGLLPISSIYEIPYLVIQNPRMMIYVIGIGIMSSVIPFLLYAYSLTKIPASQASIIASFEPIVSTLLGVFIYNEVLNISGILGIVFVFLSLVVLNLPYNKTSHTDNEVNTDSNKEILKNA